MPKVLVPVALAKTMVPLIVLEPVFDVIDEAPKVLVVPVVTVNPPAPTVKTPVPVPLIVEPESVKPVIPYVSDALLVHVPPAITTVPIVFVPVVLVNTMVPFTVVVPLTVKLTLETVKVEPLAMEIFVQAEVTLTVTFLFPSIKTTSPATGTLAPGPPPEVADHVPVEFQFPVATEYLVAPQIFPAKTSSPASTMKKTAIFLERSKFLLIGFGQITIRH